MRVTGWIILGVILLLIVLLCLAPVGVYIRYDAELLLRLRIGPISMTILPKKEKPSKTVKKDRKGKAAQSETAEGASESDAPSEKKTKFPKPNKAQIIYSLRTLPGILKKALSRTRRAILISPLYVKVVFAGDDPADIAENYGKAQALVSALFPELKKLVRIKKARIALSANYENEQMELYAEAGLRLRFGTILIIAFSAAFSMLRWFLGYRKLAAPAEKSSNLKNDKKHDQAKAA